MFFQEQQNELLDGDQEELVMRIIEQQSRQGLDFILDSKAIPKAESQELIDFLLNAVLEDN